MISTSGNKTHSLFTQWSKEQEQAHTEPQNSVDEWRRVLIKVFDVAEIEALINAELTTHEQSKRLKSISL